MGWKEKRYLGAHVSATGGIEHSIFNAASIGANTLALFLKGPNTWKSPPLTEEHIDGFAQACKAHNIDRTKILPHGSYMINLGNPDPVKRHRSFTCFLDDLERCAKLGLSLYNFHPGSTVGKCTKGSSIDFIAHSINQAIRRVPNVKVVLENAAGQGYAIGGTFEDLRRIIDLVEDSSRIGVCLDTCHLFAFGYDIRTADAFCSVLEEFDRVVGIQYLCGVHLNDSKSELGKRKDRHELIGKGRLGLECFKFIMNDCRFQKIPLILETPADQAGYKKEIEMLKEFIVD